MEKRREGKGEFLVGGRGGPHPGPSVLQSSGSRRWQKQRKAELLGPERKGPRPAVPKLSPAVQCGATTSQLRTTQPLPPVAGSGGVMQGPLLPSGVPHIPPRPLPFPLPLPSPQRVRGSCDPLPNPIPQGSGSIATATQTRRRLSASFISDIINHWSPQQHT